MGLPDPFNHLLRAAFHASEMEDMFDVDSTDPVSRREWVNLIAISEDAEEALIQHILKVRGGPRMTDYTYCVMADGETASALRLIASERWRQINEEGFTREHDDEHVHDELARMAEAYLSEDSECWPFDAVPNLGSEDTRERLRDLVKAGALIVAEIERLMRLKKRGE